MTAAIRKALRKVPGYQFARRGFRSLTEPEFRDQAALEAWINSGVDLQQRLHLEPIVFRGGRAFVETRDGIEFWWNPDAQGGMLDLHLGSDFERDERECVFSYLEGCHGAVFIDVGGNCGLYSLNLLKRFDDAQAHCFEPVPNSYRTIEVNAQHNGLSERLTLVPKALGDKPSTVRMTASYSAMDHIVVGNGDQELSPLLIDVEMVTLDGYVREHGVSRVDFLKCDVEGAELLVLKGAQNLLKEFSPPILIEIEARHTQRFNYSPQEIDSFLRNFNYEPCVPLRAGNIEKLPSIDKGIADGHHNFLYLPMRMLSS
jgi:FkbM family methyltransferase